MIKVFISCNLYPDKEVKSVKLYYEKKLPHYFLKMNMLPIVLHPSSIKDIKKIFDIYHPNLLVLSGGNTPSIYEKRYKEISKLRDDFETKLIKLFLSKRKPILGICRGMQFLNLFFGGKLSKLNNHAGTIHNIITNSNYSKYFPKLVNSYHNYGIKKNDVSNKFLPISFDKNNNIEAMEHYKKNIYAIMWHPERERKNNKKFKKFIKEIILKK